MCASEFGNFKMMQQYAPEHINFVIARLEEYNIALPMFSVTPIEAAILTETLAYTDMSFLCNRVYAYSGYNLDLEGTTHNAARALVDKIQMSLNKIEPLDIWLKSELGANLPESTLDGFMYECSDSSLRSAWTTLLLKHNNIG